VPKPGAGFRGDYRKLRVRDSIDFPQLSLAIAGRWEGQDCVELDIVVGAVGPVPKPVKKLDALVGGPLDDARVDAIARAVVKAARPNASVQGDVGWRRAMAGLYTTRMLRQLQG
jgi:CO/xanthine dehydrogenase FAD-binding subunit